MASPASASAQPRKWTPAEDRRLQAECDAQLRQTGAINDWMAVADKIPYRTNKDCRKRWSKVCATLKKGPWNADEDARLQQGVAQNGFKWTLVAQVVGSRSADQCAKRWQHSLDPQLDRSEWKDDEDRLLLEAVRQYGQSWTTISQAKFPRRSKTDIKNRYSIILRRLKQRPSYLPTPIETPENEDEDDDDYNSDYELGNSPSNPGDHAHMMSFRSPSVHHNMPAMQYDPSMSDMVPPLPPYLSPEYRSSSGSSGSGPSTPAWDQSRGMMHHPMANRMVPSPGSGSGDMFKTNDPYSMMNAMGMGYNGAPNMIDEEFTSEMLAQMSGADAAQDYMNLAGEAALHPSSRNPSTLTITIEDADPNHIDGITSMLLRSRSKFRMQQS